MSGSGSFFSSRHKRRVSGRMRCSSLALSSPLVRAEVPLGQLRRFPEQPVRHRLFGFGPRRPGDAEVDRDLDRVSTCNPNPNHDFTQSLPVLLPAVSCFPQSGSEVFPVLRLTCTVERLSTALPPRRSPKSGNSALLRRPRACVRRRFRRSEAATVALGRKLFGERRKLERGFRAGSSAG